MMKKEYQKFLDSIIIIRKLSSHTTSDMIRKEFSNYGKIEMMELTLNKRIAFIV